MDGEALVLVVALVVIVIGIVLLLVDILRHLRPTKASDDGVDLSRLMQGSGAGFAPFTGPAAYDDASEPAIELTLPVAPAPTQEPDARAAPFGRVEPQFGQPETFEAEPVAASPEVSPLPETVPLAAAPVQAERATIPEPVTPIFTTYAPTATYESYAPPSTPAVEVLRSTYAPPAPTSSDEFVAPRPSAYAPKETRAEPAPDVTRPSVSPAHEPHTPEVPSTDLPRRQFVPLTNRDNSSMDGGIGRANRFDWSGEDKESVAPLPATSSLWTAAPPVEPPAAEPSSPLVWPSTPLETPAPVEPPAPKSSSLVWPPAPVEAPAPSPVWTPAPVEAPAPAPALWTPAPVEPPAPEPYAARTPAPVEPPAPEPAPSSFWTPAPVEQPAPEPYAAWTPAPVEPSEPAPTSFWTPAPVEPSAPEPAPVVEILAPEPEPVVSAPWTPPIVDAPAPTSFWTNAPVEPAAPEPAQSALWTPAPVEPPVPEPILDAFAYVAPVPAVIEAAPEPEPEPVEAHLLLRTEGFGVGFGSKVILADVSMDVMTPGITTLMGPAGTGKSTLLRSLAGLYAQNALFKTWGRVTFHDHVLAQGNRPALVAQRIQLTQRSVFENLVFHLQELLAEVPEAKQREWVVQWLADLGVPQVADILNTSFIELEPVRQRLVTILREAAGNPALLMIDEPTAGLNEEDSDTLLSLMQALATKTPLFVVLHNQKQAKRISNQIVLLAGGRVQAQATPDVFFTGMGNPVVEQFVNTGSCTVPAPDTPIEMLAEDVPPPPPLSAEALQAIKSEVKAALAPAAPAPVRPPVVEAPPPPPPPLPVVAVPAVATPPARPQGEQAAVRRFPSASAGPRGFVWIEEGRLAATPMPGITNDVDYDLDLLTGVGITTLISLTERPFPQEPLIRHGLKNLHLSIADRKAPSPAEMDLLVSQMRQLLSEGEVLAVHCLAGLGRTGTILAAYLVKEKGLPAQVALNQIRRFNRQFVQSDDQEDFLTEYEVQNEQTILKSRVEQTPRST